MRVTLTTRISGTRDGHKWPDMGETVDLPAAEAADLVELGLAVPVPSVDAGQPETADTVPDGETTDLPAKPKARTRKATA